mmetsp:Transcript_10606/g.65423  ORF Transcript_10606/g.65423 Transcript_10606/m.65423 type:complete len:80 (-) Transcript_10606:9440-9679(-)
MPSCFRSQEDEVSGVAVQKLPEEALHFVAILRSEAYDEFLQTVRMVGCWQWNPRDTSQSPHLMVIQKATLVQVMLCLLP